MPPSPRSEIDSSIWHPNLLAQRPMVLYRVPSPRSFVASSPTPAAMPPNFTSSTPRPPGSVRGVDTLLGRLPSTRSLMPAAS